ADARPLPALERAHRVRDVGDRDQPREASRRVGQQARGAGGPGGGGGGGGRRKTKNVGRAGRRESEISSSPPGRPSSTIALPISPRSSEARAPRRVTVAPSPTTSRPCAASGERKTAADGGRTTTATRSEGAAAVPPVAAVSARPRATIERNLLAFKEADSR